MGDSKEGSDKVGIFPLEPNWSQKAIERLGPPPGNAAILIRGGAGWVFGIAPREEPTDPRITRLDKAPTRDQVALALAQEMAWRWFYGRGPFVSSTPSEAKGTSKKPHLVPRYAVLEQSFVRQMLALTPKGLSAKAIPWHGECSPFENDGTLKDTCACSPNGASCVKSCADCKET